MSASESLQEKRERRRQRRLAKDADLQVEAEERDDDDEEDSRGLTAPKGYATRGRRSQAAAEAGEEGNFITRPIMRARDYFLGVRAELQKVAWPTREEVRRLLIIVLITMVISSLALGLVGFIYNELIRLGISTPPIMIGLFVVIAISAFVLMRRNNLRRTSY